MHRNLLAVFVAMFAATAMGNDSVAEPITIAALGDSLIHGYGLPDDQGFVPQLQNALNEHHVDVLILNAGVSGDTSAGGLARVEWTLTPDVDGLIVSLGGNDALRALDPKMVRQNLDGILKAAQNHAVPVLLVGISSPSNFGPEFKTQFDAIFPELATEYGSPLYPNFLGALVALPDRENVLSNYMQSDGIHPNAKGVSLIVEDMAPLVIELIEQSASSE